MDKTVGVLGGGQLGRMLTEAANNLNIRVLTLDAANSPAKQINADPAHVVGSFTDEASIRLLASQVDVLTVEIEHVDTHVLEQLAIEAASSGGNGPKLSIQPSWETIRAIQDKFDQKKLLIRGGIATAKSLAVYKSEVPDVEDVAKLLGGYPLMLKARTDAYDGRGNFALKSEMDIPEALKVLGDRRLYAEQWASFKMELAVMVVKTQEQAGLDWEKSTLAYPAVETVHEDSICKLVYCPPRKALATTLVEAQTLARRAVAQFEGKGIFGVEMFLLEDGKITTQTQIFLV